MLDCTTATAPVTSAALFLKLLSICLVTLGAGPLCATAGEMTVLDVVKNVGRHGDIYGDGSRRPLEISREVSGDCTNWVARYWEQIGQGEKGELRRVRIGMDGKETVIASEKSATPIRTKLDRSDLERYIRLSNTDPAAVSRVDFNPEKKLGEVWIGGQCVAFDQVDLQRLATVHFERLIVSADKIVIRDGGHDCCGAKVDEQLVLASITNVSEIAEFNAMIKFVVSQEAGVCACCGHPGIDWWKDGKRIALSSVHHGFSLRWCDFPCDMVFTDPSQIALSKWFKEHGIIGGSQNGD